MGRPLINITGQRFGRLIAVEHLYKSNIWICRCDCGNQQRATGWQLRKGRVKSCGCLNSEMSAARQLKHGRYGTPEYLSWLAAKARCSNRQDERYGGRGIEMCDEWEESFNAFYKHMGARPSPKHTLDRIDVNGNYEPGNCRWATVTEQNNNARSNRRVTWNGRTQTVTQWARELGLPISTLYQRIADGWPVERAMSTPHLHPHRL